MKEIFKLLALFLFIFCIHNLSKPIVQGQEIHVRGLHTGVDGTFKLYGEKQVMDGSMKNQRGKGGVYGGANIAHQRPTDKSSAPSLVVRPQQPFLITNTMFQATFAFILIVPFQLL